MLPSRDPGAIPRAPRRAGGAAARSRCRRDRRLAALGAAVCIAHAACPVRAQESPILLPAARAALWDVAMAVPDGPNREFRFLNISIREDDPSSGPRGLLLCGALEFEDADAGVVRFALLYSRDAQGRLHPGTPFFYGPSWLRGAAELADRCAAEPSR